jgi:hypothetical protein
MSGCRGQEQGGRPCRWESENILSLSILRLFPTREVYIRRSRRYHFKSLDEGTAYKFQQILPEKGALADV